MKILAAVLIFLIIGFEAPERYDLAITNAQILDVKSGKVLSNKSILIRNGVIVRIVSSKNVVSATQIIDAKGKLVTPSFIDTHIHPADVFGDYDKAPELLQDSTINYRKQLSDQYLPFGVTSVFSMGHRESWTSTMLEWQADPNPIYTDTFTCGSAIATAGNYIGHTFVKGEDQAREKVLNYKGLGINYIKLYARFTPVEFRSAFKTADSLGMKVYGHIGDFSFNPAFITLPESLNIGLRNFEHLITIADGVLTKEDHSLLMKQCMKLYGQPKSEAEAYAWLLEKIRFADTNKRAELNVLIADFAKSNVSFSTTIALLQGQLGNGPNQDALDKRIAPEVAERYSQNFKILMKYAMLMHERGILLRIGTDTKNGGKALLSEMSLMCENGFSPQAAFKIATYNGARSMGIDDQTGTVEKGKHANLLIWDRDPLKDHSAITEGKTTIKDGIVFRQTKQP